MGKPERALKRRQNQQIQKSPLAKTLKELGSIENLKAIPGLLDETLKANKHLAEENSRLTEVISDTLEEHEKAIEDIKEQIKDLQKAVKALL